MTTKTQKNNSDKPSKESQKANLKPLKLNLVHALFIHGSMCELFHDSIDTQFKNFIQDIIYVHENVIESSENEALKEKMNYKPFNPNYHETKKTSEQDQEKKQSKKTQKQKKN